MHGRSGGYDSMIDFFEKTKGSISLFLALIMLPMMTVAGLIVDGARISAAKASLSGAGDLAMNAALSEYDQILYDVYGIFAVSENMEELQNNVSRYFANSIDNTGILNDSDSYTREFINSFTFDGSVIERSSIDGMVAETDEYSLFIYCLNDISFNTWDDIIDLAFKQMRNSMDAVFRFYPTEQTNSTSSKTENNYGETILKVSGTMEGDQTGEGTMNRQFIAFYHVTDENHVRFCVGLPKDDSSASYAALDAAMDTLIENLKKAA